VCALLWLLALPVGSQFCSQSFPYDVRRCKIFIVVLAGVQALTALKLTDPPEFSEHKFYSYGSVFRNELQNFKLFKNYLDVL
jgi:hypothetical protein